VAIVLVAYDIRDDDVRNRFAKDLERHGFTRLQKSVYARRASYPGIAKRVAQIASRRIDPRTDTVLIITIPESSMERALVLGRGGAVHGESNKIL